MRAPLLLLFLAASGLAAELHLDSAPVAVNTSAALSLHLESGESALTGVQFDVEYDASRLEVKLEIGPTAEAAVKVLQSNALQPGKLRVLIYGFNRNRIGDGVVAIARVTLKGTAEDQSYPIRISAPVATSAEGQAVPVTGTGGSVATTRSEAR